MAKDSGFKFRRQVVTEVLNASQNIGYKNSTNIRLPCSFDLSVQLLKSLG